MSEMPATGFTVKEILTEIVIPDLKAIKTSLEQKADRAEVVALEVRLGHIEGELPNMVRRQGPVMDQVRDHEKRLTAAEKEAIRRQAVIDDYHITEAQVAKNTAKIAAMPAETRERIEAALKGYDSRAELKQEKSFSKRDKMLLATLAIIGALATIISTIFMVLQASHGAAGGGG
jgi:hypothetical protein